MLTFFHTHNLFPKNILFSGIYYTAIAKYSGVVCSILTTAILAHIICPEAFGTVAIATVFLNFFSIVSTTGISPGIVQCRNLTKSDIDNLFSFTIYAGGVLCAVLAFIIPFIGIFYKNRDLVTVMYCSLPYILFSIMNTVPNALALIEKDFRFIGLRSVFFQLISGGLAILVAFTGGGIFSLLVAPTISSIGIFFITVKKYPVRIKIHFGRDSIKKIWIFSFYQILFNICNVIYRNIDKVILGNFGGMNILAQYDKSYQLVLVPVDNIANVVTPILHSLK